MKYHKRENMMFESYPKVRPVLPEKIKAIYEKQYKENREGGSAASSVAQKLESWLHKRVASDVEINHTKSTLEIGAGTLNHMQYESCPEYDIVEPFSTLFENSENLKKIRNVYADIFEIPENQTYDRVISIATFEHVLDLPKLVERSKILLKDDGVLRVSIPNEGSFLWTLGWRMTTGLEFAIKYKVDYGHLMRYEHVNNANEIEEVLKYYFSDVKVRYFGLGPVFSLYRFYECRK